MGSSGEKQTRCYQVIKTKSVNRRHVVSIIRFSHKIHSLEQFFFLFFFFFFLQERRSVYAV